MDGWTVGRTGTDGRMELSHGRADGWRTKTMASLRAVYKNMKKLITTVLLVNFVSVLKATSNEATSIATRLYASIVSSWIVSELYPCNLSMHRVVFIELFHCISLHCIVITARIKGSMDCIMFVSTLVAPQTQHPQQTNKQQTNMLPERARIQHRRNSNSFLFSHLCYKKFFIIFIIAI